jgi:heme-degrading monooxygenase HmoA
MIHVLWEFEVEAERAEEFEREYGGEGGWVKLFRRGEGYQGTTLLRDRDKPLRYVTVDRWSSREAYDAFRRRYADEYAAIDARCEKLTRAERLIGYFEEVQPLMNADRRR